MGSISSIKDNVFVAMAVTGLIGAAMHPGGRRARITGFGVGTTFAVISVAAQKLFGNKMGWAFHIAMTTGLICYEIHRRKIEE